jgi:hypothetical protein
MDPQGAARAILDPQRIDLWCAFLADIDAAGH